MLWDHHICGKLFKGMHKWCLESWKGQRRYYKEKTKHGVGENFMSNNIFIWMVCFYFIRASLSWKTLCFEKDFKWTSWPTCRWRRKPLIEWGLPKPPLWQLLLPPGLGIALSGSSWYKVDYKQQSSLLLLGPFSAVHQKRSPPELLL